MCLSHLKGLGTAWNLYLTAHGGRFLQGPNADINYGGRQGVGAAAFGSDPSKPVPKPLNEYAGKDAAQPFGDATRLPEIENLVVLGPERPRPHPDAANSTPPGRSVHCR